MTNKEAIEILKPLTEYSVDKNGIGTFPMVSTPLQAEALDLAIKALTILDDVNHKVYRNENCDRAGKCYDYLGWHCAGCGEVKKNET